MSPPTRRRVLAAAGAAGAAALAGCQSGDDAAEPSPADTTADEAATTDEQTADDPLQVRVTNGFEGPTTVTVTVSEDGDPLVERTETVPAGDFVLVDSGVGEPGTYEVRVRVEDGPTESLTWDVEAYDVRQGSNVLVDVSADGIDFAVEE